MRRKSRPAWTPLSRALPGAPIETPASYQRDLAVGETGSGKSRLSHLRWEQWSHANAAPVMVLDLSGSPRFPKLPPPSRGWYVVPEVAWDSTLDGPAFEFVNAWCRKLYDWAEETGRPCMLSVDETNLCIRGQQVPPALLNIVMHGRKLGISYQFATRRFVEIPAKLRSQADEVFCFNQDDPTDLRAAEDRGFDPDAVRQLRTGQFFHKARGVPPHLHHGVTSECRLS